MLSEINNSVNILFALPEELTVHICTFLPKSDLTKRVPLVCKDLYRIANDNALWKETTIRKFGPVQGQVHFIEKGSWKAAYIALQRLDIQAQRQASRFHDHNVKIGNVVARVMGLHINPYRAPTQLAHGNLAGRRVTEYRSLT